MARRGSKSCVVRTIHFKAHGRHVVFRGRPGGQTSHGGVCGVKADKPGEKRAQREFARAARRCTQSSRRARNACVRAKMR